MTIELLNIDCMEYMAEQPDGAFDLAIVDPPYGLGKRLMEGGRKKQAGRMSAAQYDGKAWDIPPQQEYFDELMRVSQNQIIWGGNYFDLPPHRGFVIWDKKQPLPTFSFGEMAWTSFDKPAFKIEFAYTNYVEGCDRPAKKIHPTQKPIGLYERLLDRYAGKEMRILDTHLGSGSSAIAAHYFGCDFVGCEIDPDYYQAAKDRFDRDTAQRALFG